jgi:hypothetical protein
MNQGPHAITPVVSVIMPTWNGERFLRPAIDSILNQTLTDFELIVIDDGSTDSTPRILTDYKDDRLVVLTNEHNLGIAGATNRGLAAARGEYVALQDHDDISLPQRFQVQVEYLDSHPEIALVGSGATLIDQDGTPLPKTASLEIWPTSENRLSTDDLNLKWHLLFGCPFYHVSVMVRRGAILDVGGYRRDPSFQCAQDFEFLSRLGMRYRVANLKESLVLWRRHSGSVGRQHSERQLHASESISFRNLCAVDNARYDDSHAARQHRARRPQQVSPHDRGDSANRYQWFRYLGLKAFLHTPAGSLPDLPSEQVLAGAQFLYDINDTFYKVHGFTRANSGRHRAPLNWTWGKHAVGLAVRSHWDWRSRFGLLRFGFRSIGQAAWAFLSTVFGENHPLGTSH